MIVLFSLVGFWFWFAWAASACWLFVAVYNDRYAQATIDLVLFVTLLSITGNIHLADSWQWILHNPGTIVFGIFAYLGIGVVWSLIKWRLMLRRFKAILREAGLGTRHGENLSRFELPYELTRNGLKIDNGKIRLEVDHFKAKIVGWMTYWWVSMPVWVIGDAMHELFETLYLGVRRFYQRMADSALND